MAIQTTGIIRMADLAAEFGASSPQHLSHYYRGGSRVPATRTIDTSGYVYQPSSGWYASNSYSVTNSSSTNMWYWIWAGSTFYSGTGTASGTSLTYGGWTYYRGSHYKTDSFSDGKGTTTYTYRYQIRRRQWQTSSSTQNINTGVPTSGTLRLSDFYGATKT